MMKRHDISTYFAAFGIKSSEIIDVAKIKMDIHSLNKKKDDELLHIGNMVYKMYLQNKFDEKKISDKCSSIVEIDKRIAGKENEVSEVHNSAERVINETIKEKKKRDKHKGSTKKDESEYSSDNHNDKQDSKELIEAEYEVKPLD